MKHIDFEFNGEKYALSLTADALFRLYDKFGVVDNLLDASHALEPSAEGWANLCYIAALLAAQGELQRRHMGELPKPMLQAEDLRTGIMARESLRLREAVQAAFIQGFEHEKRAEDEPEEVNEVLKMREEAEKKTGVLLRYAESIWRELSGSSDSP